MKTDTKTTLLKTAVELIWGQSYGGVSVDDICRKANAKKGSFYHYFPSKAELAVAALDFLWDEMRPVLDQTFSPQIPPLDRLRKYADDAIADQKELKAKRGYVVGCPFTSIGSEQCSCDDGVSRRACEAMNRMASYFQSAIQDAIDEGLLPANDSKRAARQLLAFELGAMSLARVSNSLEPLEGMYETFLDILRKGQDGS